MSFRICRTTLTVITLASRRYGLRIRKLLRRSRPKRHRWEATSCYRRATNHEIPIPETLRGCGLNLRAEGGVLRIRTFVSIGVFAAVLAVPALAQEGEMPQMTPEQQAEMEAYTKAGALGPQHEMMAKHGGTYNELLKGGPVTNRYEAKWTSPDLFSVSRSTDPRIVRR
jgi:hypothetical protein